jgi:hypothetical protein
MQLEKWKKQLKMFDFHAKITKKFIIYHWCYTKIVMYKISVTFYIEIHSLLHLLGKKVNKNLF